MQTGLREGKGRGRGLERVKEQPPPPPQDSLLPSPHVIGGPNEAQ